MLKPHDAVSRPAGRVTSDIRKGVTGLCIIICAGILLYGLSLRFISRIYIYAASRHSQKGYYGLAAGLLEKAASYQPRDDEIRSDLGHLYFQMGNVRPASPDALFFWKKSEDAYLRASDLNPLDADIAYGLARIGVCLKKWYDGHASDPKSRAAYDPIPYFQEAIRLRPNGVQYRYAFVRYLAEQLEQEKMLPVVRRLVQTYPPVYNHLKKEAFWDPSVQRGCLEGLEEAIRQRNLPGSAHALLSGIRAEDGNWDKAIWHYRKSLTFQTVQNSANNHIHLGHLYLKNGQIGEAEKNFSLALFMSPNKENALKRLYHTYKKDGQTERFLPFLDRIEKNFILSDRMALFMARILIDLKQYPEARQALKQANQTRPDAEAYYWLARIAELEKDWDRMELAIQKATVLSPRNSQYHLKFSSVLKRLGKFKRAEIAANLAISHHKMPSPWLFNHRAWIRWSRGNFQSALEDWEQAIRLKPDWADFYAYAAEACRKLGIQNRVAGYYQKAASIEPDNANYQKKYLDAQI